ncbi:NepR family anti-sigma factor [Pelagerythrobacter marensis]|uniref:Anti-sigma factor NepR domain-containing protein n=1 Tax=Pelagerythrobacter marensis TaxID=543877 RepID=A0A0G3X723_9SPHN|nr:NepR family anti-sigma factor [Pelagerythrobacter marensis]AKM06153.1 hypothetical protein AM2010_61 [Pelagerythrobacter marensis]
MHTDGDRRTGETGKGDAKAANRDNPGWADGLRQLYDSVVEEPLPDSFKELLSKLDDKS